MFNSNILIMATSILSAHVHRNNDDLHFIIYESTNGLYICSWWLSSDLLKSHFRTYKSYVGALTYLSSTLDNF